MRTGRRAVVVVLVVEVVVVVLEKVERPGDFKVCRSSNGMDCMTNRQWPLGVAFQANPVLVLGVVLVLRGKSINRVVVDSPGS